MIPPSVSSNSNIACIRCTDEARQLPCHVDAVAAVGHVGDRPALEIAIGQSRQLAQQRHAQT